MRKQANNTSCHAVFWCRSLWCPDGRFFFAAENKHDITFHEHRYRLIFLLFIFCLFHGFVHRRDPKKAKHSSNFLLFKRKHLHAKTQRVWLVRQALGTVFMLFTQKRYSDKRIGVNDFSDHNGVFSMIVRLHCSATHFFSLSDGRQVFGHRR